MLDQHPWWPDPALRLIRNIEGIRRFPLASHAVAEVAGAARFLEAPLYQLGLVLDSRAEREEKVALHNRRSALLRTDMGFAVNATYYLPELVRPAPQVAALPADDARVVRAALDAVVRPLPAVGTATSRERLHVRSVDRRAAPVDLADVTVAVVNHLPLRWISGRPATVTVRVTNHGARTWRSTDDPATLVGGRILDASGALEGGELRATLPCPVRPGATELVRLSIGAAPEPGDHRLDVGVVQEGVGWAGVCRAAVRTSPARRIVLSTESRPTPDDEQRSSLTDIVDALMSLSGGRARGGRSSEGPATPRGRAHRSPVSPVWRAGRLLTMPGELGVPSPPSPPATGDTSLR